MIEILGLITALFAGVFADGFFRGNTAQDEDGFGTAPRDQDDSHSTATGFFLGRTTFEIIEGTAQSNDLPVARDADETLSGTTGADTLFGLGGDDLILGGAGHDLLGGRDGEDTLFGDFGDDYLIGGDGNDRLDGGADHDTLYGENGDDTLIGALGNDVIYAGAGDDWVQGGSGADDLFGGEGADSIYGGDGADSIEGGLGDDALFGGAGNDELFGDFGNDTLWGNMPGATDTDIDFLNGGAGDDVLMLGAGDYGHGGEGADQFIITDYGSGTVQITDFDQAEDFLIIAYSGAEPVLSVAAQADGSFAVLLDGVVAAVLNTAVQPSDIILRANQ